MRYVFLSSVISFCAFAAVGLFSFFRRRSARPLDLFFIAFCTLLSFWALGTALFVSSPIQEEALFWFRLFAFSWYLTPGVFAMFAFVFVGASPKRPILWAALFPGIVLLLMHVLDPKGIVSQVAAVEWGWHITYARTPWALVNTMNSSLLTLVAGIVFGWASLGKTNHRRRSQARVIFAFFVPTFIAAFISGIITRWLGITSLPPLAPSFFFILVIGLSIALFRYGMLELNPSGVADRILSSVADAVILIDTAHTVVYSNLRGSVRNGRASDFFPDLQMDTVDGEAEGQCFFESDQARPAVIRWKTVFDRDGGDLGTVLTAHDLTDRKRFEREAEIGNRRAEALRSAEENFSRVFRYSAIGMLISEINTSVIIEVNDAACALSGLSRETIIGSEMWSLGISIDQEEREALRAALRQGESSGSREILFRRENGPPVIAVVTAVPIRFDGKNAALISVLDISELSALRQEIYKAQKLESIGMMAGGLAHDFNNIMTAIMGNISVARLNVESGSEVAEALAGAAAACARARELSRQLLSFSRGESNPEKGEPRDIFEIVLEASRIALSGSSVRAVFSAEPELPAVRVDREQMSQVFGNLARNAVQAMPNGGALKIRAFTVDVEEGARLTDDIYGDLLPGRYVGVEFIDSGRGIAPEYLGRVFDPYFAAGRQNGLSLAVCYSLARRHKGSIGVSSMPGKGSTFTVYLPAAIGSGEMDAARTDQNPSGPRGKILLMDDELAIRTVAERMLARLGFSTVVCADGAAAVAAFKEARAKGERFAAVVLDLTVPDGMSGAVAASVLRSLDATVPIFISSGYLDDPTVTEYAIHGFSGVIPKPYSLEELSIKLADIRG